MPSPLRYLTALPVFNEESHVAPVLEEVKRYSPHVLAVDDGSSDGTADVLRSVEGIEVLTHDVNQGYGAALRSAFDYTIEQGYDALVTIDCDGQHQPKLIPDLVEALLRPATYKPVSPSALRSPLSADVVSSSRYLEIFDGDSIPPEERRRINVEITATLNDRFGLHLTDAFCGFKAYHVDALKKFDITELGYAMPLQLWVQAVAREMSIVEFPVPLIYLEEERSFGGSLDDSDERLAYYQQVLEREFATHPGAVE